MPRGYGRIQSEVVGSVLYAHRASWIIHFGPIADGLEVCHKCNVTACVNPKHLYLADHATNIAHAKRDGIMRGPEGHRNHNCKLTDEQVRRLRKAEFKEEIEDLAEKFSVTVRHAWRVRNGERRAGVK